MHRFSILEGDPEPLVRTLADQLTVIHGDWQHAQRVPINSRQVWVIPASGRLCLVDGGSGESPSFVCNAVHRVVKSGMFLASVPTSSAQSMSMRWIVGVVPDGIVRVRIRAPGAKLRQVPVVENVFALRDHGRAFPESIDLIRGG